METCCDLSYNLECFKLFADDSKPTGRVSSGRIVLAFVDGLLGSPPTLFIAVIHSHMLLVLALHFLCVCEEPEQATCENV